MKSFCLLTTYLLLLFSANGQILKQRLDQEVKTFLADSQMKHGILGLYIADAQTGEQLYQVNSQMGLAPASTQKVVTSVAALDLLGKDFRYRTDIGYTGSMENDMLKGDLYIRASGDPSFGSWRYASTRSELVLQQLKDYLQRFRIRTITGKVLIDISRFGHQPLPGGWIWDDIGNYYGAGSWAMNWRENQYDLLLRGGKKEGDPVEITGTEPRLRQFNVVNNLTTGRRGSGDNAYIYYPPYSATGFVEGTFEGSGKISGSFPDAPRQFAFELEAFLQQQHITTAGVEVINAVKVQPDVFFAHHSPGMDSLVYWFMRRSINLYGESIVKTIGYEKAATGSTDSGVAVIRRYFRDKGIVTPAELRIMDGSGLSPSNRITPAALGKILLYARKQSWYPAFLQSFPDNNGMKLKSGTIRGVKSYAGYHTAKNGKEYVVVILVNNYDGSAGAIVNKMFRLLDVLK